MIKAVIFEDNKIKIYFPFNRSDLELVRSLYGRQYIKEEKHWTIPVTDAGASVSSLKEAGFLVDFGVIKAIENDVKQKGNLEIINKGGFIFKTSLPLYDFQTQAVAFMVQSASCVNCLPVGSGKTAMVIATLDYLATQKNLIVVPKSILYQFQNEIRKFLPNAKTFLVDGTKSKREEGYREAGNFRERFFLIVSYEIARIDIDYLLHLNPFDAIVYDEIHRLASPFIKTRKALKKLQAKYIYGLTATPLVNRIADIYGIIDMVKGGVMGSWNQFADRYIIRDRFGGIFGYQNQEEIKNKIKRFMIRKTLEEIGLELPEKTILDVPFDLGTEEKNLYNKIKKELLLEIEKAEISKVENPVMLQMTLVKLGKLQELCDSMELLGEKSNSTKLEILKEHLTDNLTDGSKAIVVSRFERMVRILSRELREYNPLVITGAVNLRQPVIDDFQNNENARLLIMTDAGSSGLNLERANILYHYDLPYSVGKYEQRNGRIHRIKQIQPVSIFNLLARGTVDMAVRSILWKKQRIADELFEEKSINFKDIKEMLTSDVV